MDYDNCKCGKCGGDWRTYYNPKSNTNIVRCVKCGYRVEKEGFHAAIMRFSELKQKGETK